MHTDPDAFLVELGALSCVRGWAVRRRLPGSRSKGAGIDSAFSERRAVSMTRPCSGRAGLPGSIGGSLKPTGWRVRPGSTLWKRPAANSRQLFRPCHEGEHPSAVRKGAGEHAAQQLIDHLKKEGRASTGRHRLAARAGAHRRCRRRAGREHVRRSGRSRHAAAGPPCR